MSGVKFSDTSPRSTSAQRVHHAARCPQSAVQSGSIGQIIGRGTRLYDGKDYFTIYDFVRAHLHFGDPEWDGEPIEPEPPQGGGGPGGRPEPQDPGPLPEPGQPRQKIKINWRTARRATSKA